MHGTLACMLRFFALCLGVSLSLGAAAQQPEPAFNSHEVHPDGSVTLRYRNAGAKAVTVNNDMALTPFTMTRDDSGVWSVTTPPLKPEIYSYTFVVDGVGQLDPVNHDVVANLQFFSSNVTVPGATAEPWELQAIPHGEVSHHMLTTKIAKNLPLNQEPYVVWTPPGYDAKHKGGYPVLYLLHGWSDSEVGWTAVGHAERILDAMLAQGRIVPMVVVMPQGYGDFDFVMGGHKGWDQRSTTDENVSLYEQMLLTEIMPAVDHEYNIAHGREHHAIAGLSMGGLESLGIGLRHTDEFAWVGGFSAAVMQHAFDERFGAATGDKASKLKLLWVACGENEELLEPNHDFIAWAKAKGLPVTAYEAPGKHTWPVWRDDLLHFAPLLFRGGKE